MVEEDCTDIIQMPIESKQTSASLVGPDLDLVIISTRDEEGLCLVEVNSSYRSIVLLKSINQRSHTIVPKLDGRRVKRDKNPWSAKLLAVIAPVKLRGGPFGVECDSFCSRRFGLEL